MKVTKDFAQKQARSFFREHYPELWQDYSREEGGAGFMGFTKGLIFYCVDFPKVAHKPMPILIRLLISKKTGEVKWVQIGGSGKKYRPHESVRVYRERRARDAERGRPIR